MGDREFFLKEAARLLYTLEQRGLIRMVGATLDDVHANIETAKQLIADRMEIEHSTEKRGWQNKSVVKAG